MVEINYEIAIQIKEFLENDELDGLKIFLGTLEPVTIAASLKFLSDDEKIKVFNCLPVWSASIVLGETDELSQEYFSDELDSDHLSTLLEEMDSDDAVDILDDLDKGEQEKILAEIEEEKARVLRSLLQYSEDSAGGIMVPELLAINQNCSVIEAIHLFKKSFHEDDIKDIQIIYVINDKYELVGRLPIKYLLLYPDEYPLKDIMDTNVIAVKPNDDQEFVANLVRKYDLYSIPVIDNNKKLIGRITADDILDVIHEEAAEDLSHIAGMSDEEFDQESVFRSVWNRIPWLLIGLTGGIISASVVSHFQDALNVILALAFFVPVVTAMGGNAGVQSSAIIVRGLAMGDIHPKYILNRLAREFRIAMINGFVCAFVLTLVVSVWRHDMFLGLLIGLSLQVVIILATLVGTTIPLVLKAINVDPAIAMGPFVTTLNDIIGLFIYLSLSTFAIYYFLR